MEQHWSLRSVASGAVVSLCACALPAAAQSPGDDVFLIPNSLRDSISVCESDGDLLSLYYVYLPANPDGPSPQPIQVVPTGTGTLLIADEVLAQVAEFNTDGKLIRVLAGPDDGLVSAYSLCVSGGFVYFTAPTIDPKEPKLIWKVPADGSAPPSVFFDFTPLGVPRGIIRVQTPTFDGFYVGDSAGDDIERITIGGTAITPFHDSDGVTGIDFPQQLLMLPDGTLLAAGFSAPSGIYQYDAQGNEISYVFTISPRGVHPIPSGEYLFSAGVNLWAVDPEAGTSRLVHGGQSSDSFRFITPWRIPGGACPADFDGSGNIDGIDLAALLAQWGSSGNTDLDGDGTVSGTDLTFILSAWGPC
jgi:hypothetical protein